MILRTCVVLPTCNDLRVISEVVKQVLLATPFPVLIIDDGSSSPVENVLYSWEVRQALENGRVKVVRFEKTRGKGAALSFAIHHLISRGFTHMITMDGDGRHNASEISRLTGLAQVHPWDLIIGVRQMPDENGGEAGGWARRITNKFLNYETGSHLKDSASGFRMYPLFPLQTMNFVTSNNEFEIEILIRLMWRGIHVREVDINVPYPDRQEVAAHRRYWDDIRISVLNILLIMVSLVKTHRRPVEVATAMSLGVFVGCTPFFGFHTIIVAILAFALRLNFLVMWIGSHVSTPILAPLVVLTEIWIGRNWMHLGLEGGARGDFVQWIGGSLILGVALTVFSWIATYLTARSFANRQHPANWAAAHARRLHSRFFKWIFKRWELPRSYWVAAALAPMHYIFSRGARRGLDEYWKILEPDDDWWTRQKQILGHFYQFGKVQIDQVASEVKQEALFDAHVTGPEKIDGATLMSATMGNCEMAAKLADAGGSEQVLRIDRDANGSLELIPFMGKIALFDVGPFYDAAANGSRVIFTFGFKGDRNTYDFYARSMKEYHFNNEQPREIQCYQWAKEFVHDVQMFVERYPDQWFNFFPFWSYIPESGASHAVFLEDLKPERAALDAHP